MTWTCVSYVTGTTGTQFGLGPMETITYGTQHRPHVQVVDADAVTPTGTWMNSSRTKHNVCSQGLYTRHITSE